MDIIVNELPPIIKAARDIKKVVIPGRDGFLTEDLKAYNGTVKPVECTIRDLSRIDEILEWLDGSGPVIFSNQDDREYQATIINQIPFIRVIEKWRTFVVIFDCQPFALMLNNPLITLVAPGSITNTGTHESKPVIKIYGNGTIDLTVNGNAIHLTNIVGDVTIDSPMMDAYKGTQLMNQNMLGDFPRLAVGANGISWTGTVTKVEITPNWVML